jgi:drug/metabolite transporter (DMT)-like permease
MSEWNNIFNERGLLLAFFGALGGAVRSAALKTTWREGLRVMFIGSSTAFGVGVLAPFLLRPWIGDLPDGMAGALGTLCAAAFLIGLMAVTLIERMAAGKSVGPESGSDAE